MHVCVFSGANIGFLVVLLPSLILPTRHDQVAGMRAAGPHARFSCSRSRQLSSWPTPSFACRCPAMHNTYPTVRSDTSLQV